MLSCSNLLREGVQGGGLGLFVLTIEPSQVDLWLKLLFLISSSQPSAITEIVRKCI